MRRTLHLCLRTDAFGVFPHQSSLSWHVVQTCSRTRLSFPTEVIVFDTPPEFGSSLCLYLPLDRFLSEGLSGFLPLIATIVNDFIHIYTFRMTRYCRTYVAPPLHSSSSELGCWISPIKTAVRFAFYISKFSRLGNL